MCKFVAVNRVGKPCALVAHARFEMGAVDLEFLSSAAYLIVQNHVKNLVGFYRRLS